MNRLSHTLSRFPANKRSGLQPWHLAGAIALLSLTACGGSSTKASTIKPAPLVKLESNTPLQKGWSRSVGKGDERSALALVPAMVGNRIYTAAANGTVTALEKETGEIIWKKKVDTRITAGPGADIRVVAVAGENGQLVALNPENGEQLWRISLSGELLAPPLADRGLVIFRTLDGRIRAVSAIDGTQQWILNRAVPRLTLRGNSPLVLKNERIYVGLDNGKLMAIKQRDGSLLWESVISIPSGRGDIERMTDIDGAPLAADGDVYVNSFQGKLAAAAAESGRVLWAIDFSGLRSLAAYEDYLLAVNTDGEIVAVDRYTSSEYWKQDKLHHRGLTGPVVLDEIAIVGDADGYLHMLNIEDGSLIGRTRVDRSAIINTPKVVDDVLYVQTAGGKLATYSLPDPDKPAEKSARQLRKEAKQRKKEEKRRAKEEARLRAAEEKARKQREEEFADSRPAAESGSSEQAEPEEPPVEDFDSQLDEGFGTDNGGFQLGN